MARIDDLEKGLCDAYGVQVLAEITTQLRWCLPNERAIRLNTVEMLFMFQRAFVYSK